MGKNPIKKIKRRGRTVFCTTVSGTNSPDGKRKYIERTTKEEVEAAQNALLEESKHYGIKNYKLSREIEDAVKIGLNGLNYKPTPSEVVQIFNDHIKYNDSEELSLDVKQAVINGLNSLDYDPSPKQIEKIFQAHALDKSKSIPTFNEVWIKKMKSMNKDFAPENIGITDKGNSISDNYANLRFIGKHFSKDHGDLPVHRIDRPMIWRFLDTFDVSSVSKASYRRWLAAILADPCEEGIIDLNPAHSTTRKRNFFKKPKALSLEKVVRILATAPEDLIPYYAIMLFGGLRIREICDLQWSEVILDDNPRIIVFDPKGATDKQVPNRQCQVLPVLEEWLKPFKDYSGPVFPRNWKANKVYPHRISIGLMVKGLGDKGKEENYKLYPPNCLRHTCCTAWCALTDEYKSAKQTGNSAKKQRSNYNHVWVHGEERKYFSLTPDEVKKEYQAVGMSRDSVSERKISL